MPNDQMKFGQLSHQNSANCRIEIRPTVAFATKLLVEFEKYFVSLHPKYY